MKTQSPPLFLPRARAASAATGPVAASISAMTTLGALLGEALRGGAADAGAAAGDEGDLVGQTRHDVISANA